MKKFSIILILFVLLSKLVSAQGEIMEIFASATLESLLILNVEPDIEVEFGVIEVTDNLYQITKHPDDIHFSVESTDNWTLSITSSDKFTCLDDTSCKIPIDFVSYYIESKGTNWDNGLFSDIANRTKDTTLTLSPEKTTVLVNGSKNNIGGAEQNTFVLRWDLSFVDDLFQMNNYSKLKIKDGYYKANIYLTLTENRTITLPN